MNWQTPQKLPDLRRVGIVALDIETRDNGLHAGRGSAWPWGDGYVCGISIAWREGDEIHASYISLRHPASENYDRDDVIRWLRDTIAAGVKFTTMNGIYDWGWIGSDLGVAIPPPEQIEEAGAAAALVDENLPKYSLDALCQTYGLPGKDMAPLHEAIEAAGLNRGRKNYDPREFIWRLAAAVVADYARGDAINTLRLFEEKLYPILIRENTHAAYRLECRLVPVVLAMRRRGIRIDEAAAVKARDLLLAKRDAALEKIADLVGTPVSMKEIRSLAWKTAALDARGVAYPRNDKGNPSFEGGGAGWMTGHPDALPQLIAEVGKYHKAGHDFIQTHILGHVVNKRIFAEVNPFLREEGGTRSSRFSYSHPPLQQLPSHDEEISQLIRGCCLPEDDEQWVDCDISQQEFRVLVDYGVQYDLPGAHEAAEVYCNNPNADIHVTVAEMIERDRKTAKGANFGKVYGMGKKTFAEKIGKPVEEAQAIMAKYDAKLPFVKALSEICQKLAERSGYISLIDGARRHFKLYEAAWIPWTTKNGPCPLEEARLRAADPTHPWHGQQLRRAGGYKALNALVQGTSARCTKIWLCDVYYKLGIIPMLQMHDALCCSVKSYEQAEAVARLGCDAVKLTVPVRVDMKFGESWADATHTWAELTEDPRPGRDKTFVITRAGAPASRPAPQMPERKAALAASPTPITKPAIAPAVTPPTPIMTPADGALKPTSDIGTCTVWVTFFGDKLAQKLSTAELTLPQLAEFIGMNTAPSKMELPWLKLSRFGDKATEKRCLRHDANVLTISGIEVEHDAGEIAFLVAIAVMREAQIRCLLYTSPSWVEGVKEKWRILLPLSKQQPPELRAKLVARVNGVLKGAITNECFVSSQAYLFGHLDGAVHREMVIDGDFVDERDDLDQGAIGKVAGLVIERTDPAHWTRPNNQLTPGRNDDEIAALLELSQKEGEWHNAMLSATATMVGLGWSDDQIYEATAPYCWHGRGDPDVETMVEGARAKWNAPDRDAVAQNVRVALLHATGGAGAASGVASGGTGSGNASGGGTAEASTRKLPWLDMSNWDNEPIPERKWAIPDCVPLNQVGLFSGEGGTGKSIVEIMKNIAHVAAKDWLGLPPVQGGAFYLGAEDETDELHIRLAVIARHYGVTFAELIKGGLQVLPLLGEDAVLCAVNPRSGRVEPTALYWQIHEQAGDLKPRNISVDTLSRAFAGNEIDRSQVYGFAMYMQAIAKVASGSVTVLSHPSLAGMASGSGISGSTAWHGAFRFRQYLKGVKAPGAEEISPGAEPDNGLRLLEFKKNQYGPLGASIALRYENGLFLPEQGATDAEKLVRQEQVQQVFMQLLERFNGQGRNVSHARTSNNYAPVTFAKETEAIKHGLRKADFEAAMRDLFAAERIKVETYGRPSRQFQRLIAL
jgi:DNA polymerase I-like protein with 3'-5' exonuclease and polymerase domains/RecA-family ATPase